MRKVEKFKSLCQGQFSFFISFIIVVFILSYRHMLSWFFFFFFSFFEYENLMGRLMRLAESVKSK